MKRFLKKRWHGVPVGVMVALLTTCLVASVVMAYTMLQGDVTVEVDEAITTYYDWVGNATWVEVVDGFALTITGAYPGETADVGIKFVNASSAPLTVTGTATLTAHPTGGAGDFTVSNLDGLFGAGVEVPGGGELVLVIQGEIAGDAPPGNYTMSLSFARH